MLRFPVGQNWKFSIATSVLVCVTLFAACEQAQTAQEPEQESASEVEKKTNDQDAKPAPTDSNQTKTQAEDKTPAEPEWEGKSVALMSGDELDDWETIEFGGEGQCTISKGLLTFEAGDPFTGISSTHESLPKTNYEVSLEARKMQGTDFFCGLTFPVADSHCTLIAGGWGGATVGLSCIDDKDASRNETCTYMKFEKEQWYKIRVRVQPETISVWIDDQQVVNQNIVGKKISLRGDTGLCKPMGLCSFMTIAEYKNFNLRRFKPIVAKSDPTTEKPEAVDKK